jgi:hypothetical protein
MAPIEQEYGGTFWGTHSLDDNYAAGRAKIGKVS